MSAHRLLFLFTLSLPLPAGIVQGVVVELSSGRPLSRTIIRLDPIPQSGADAGPSISLANARSGHFLFQHVPPGVYFLTAVHDGFFPCAYGQRLPAGHGTPIQVTADSDFFTELRMRHQGAITGRVLDENGVGTAGVEVLAYRARLPLQAAGSSKSDDRGIYRIHGLQPGKYWVRSAAHTFDDSSAWLPTFGPQGREVHDARIHPVTLETDAQDADLNPEPGRLFHLGGTIACDRDGPVSVTLTSETGRRRIAASCKGPYRFDSLAPGYYEVFVSTPDGSAAGFTELFLDRDSEIGVVQVMQIYPSRVEVTRGNSPLPAKGITLIARRQDLSETETPKEYKGSTLILAPGNWALRASAPDGLCLDSITAMNRPRRPVTPERDPDWFEVFIEPRGFGSVRVKLSDQCGLISGQVITAGKPLAGAPVFLWPTKDAQRRSLGGPQQAIADVEGRFRFRNLPVGDYRLVASFDFNEIDEELVELSRAITISAQANQTAVADLPLWTAPY